MRPVFFFDMCVIVFVISAGAGELDGLFSIREVSIEMPVKEFGAIVTVESQNRERKRFFNAIDSGHYTSFALPPYGSLDAPSGGNIHAVNAIDEHARHRVTAMGEGIGFEESGNGFLPLIGFYRDMFPEDTTRFGGSQA
jgi:hypothetical protein